MKCFMNKLYINILLWNVSWINIIYNIISWNVSWININIIILLYEMFHE